MNVEDMLYIENNTDFANYDWRDQISGFMFPQVMHRH